ncbi:actin filament network formation [Blomia tropicalis]|nr:actin filament network formation [Blomia tropicalis]
MGKKVSKHSINGVEPNVDNDVGGDGGNISRTNGKAESISSVSSAISDTTITNNHSHRQSLEDDCAIKELLEGRMKLTINIIHRSEQVVISVERRTPLLDLLVNMATQYHFNASDYMIQVDPDELQTNSCVNEYKASTMIGLLNVSKVSIVPRQERKVPSKKNLYNRQQSLPNELPFKPTIRLTVNLPHKQLMVIRLLPSTPLCEIKQMICTEKSFDPEQYILVKPFKSGQENPFVFDLEKSLDYYHTNEVTILPIKCHQKLVKQFTSSDISHYASSSMYDEESNRLGRQMVNDLSQSTPNVMKPNGGRIYRRGLSESNSNLSVNRADSTTRSVKSYKSKPAPPPPLLKSAKSVQHLPPIRDDEERSASVVYSSFEHNESSSLSGHSNITELSKRTEPTSIITSQPKRLLSRQNSGSDSSGYHEMLSHTDTPSDSNSPAPPMSISPNPNNNEHNSLVNNKPPVPSQRTSLYKQQKAPAPRPPPSADSISLASCISNNNNKKRRAPLPPTTKSVNVESTIKPIESNFPEQPTPSPNHSVESEPNSLSTFSEEVSTSATFESDSGHTFDTSDDANITVIENTNLLSTVSENNELPFDETLPSSDVENQLQLKIDDTIEPIVSSQSLTTSESIEMVTKDEGKPLPSDEQYLRPTLTSNSSHNSNSEKGEEHCDSEPNEKTEQSEESVCHLNVIQSIDVPIESNDQPQINNNEIIPSTLDNNNHIHVNVCVDLEKLDEEKEEEEEEEEMNGSLKRPSVVTISQWKTPKDTDILLNNSSSNVDLSSKCARSQSGQNRSLEKQVEVTLDRFNETLDGLDDTTDGSLIYNDDPNSIVLVNKSLEIDNNNRDNYKNGTSKITISNASGRELETNKLNIIKTNNKSENVNECSTQINSNVSTTPIRSVRDNILRFSASSNLPNKVNHTVSHQDLSNIRSLPVTPNGTLRRSTSKINSEPFPDAQPVSLNKSNINYNDLPKESAKKVFNAANRVTQLQQQSNNERSFLQELKSRTWSHRTGLSQYEQKEIDHSIGNSGRSINNNNNNNNAKRTNIARESNLFVGRKTSDSFDANVNEIVDNSNRKMNGQSTNVDNDQTNGDNISVIVSANIPPPPPPPPPPMTSIDSNSTNRVRPLSPELAHTNTLISPKGWKSSNTIEHKQIRSPLRPTTSTNNNNCGSTVSDNPHEALLSEIKNFQNKSKLKKVTITGPYTLAINGNSRL